MYDVGNIGGTIALTRHHLTEVVGVAALTLALTACGGGGDAGATPVTGGGGGSSDTTSGAAFEQPSDVDTVTLDANAAITENDGSIDVSRVDDGIVLAEAVSAAKLKFVVMAGEMTYAYDLPSDGTPITCPINMGDGFYEFAIMRNTGGNNYVETNSCTSEVHLTSEFAPFSQPNVFCSYTDSSACVDKARELVSSAENQGDAVKAVCNYIVQNVSYDTDKASQLSGTSGYVPNPDETFSTNKGICFDYASLGAAMLRSVGIPTKIITGYVSPEDLYHAWIMVYIDGSWSSAQFSVNPQSWSRVDLTFAADSSITGLVGDGKTYTERYVY